MFWKSGTYHSVNNEFLCITHTVEHNDILLIFDSNHTSIQMILDDFNLLQTKRRPLYLKTQSVPRCKHFSSRL